MAQTKDETIREVTVEYLAGIDMNNIPSSADIQAGILDGISNAFDIENAIRSKDKKWRAPERLSPVQIAMIAVALHPVAAIETAGKNSDKSYRLLGIYQDDGENTGIYDVTDEALENLAEMYCFGMTEREVAEFKRHLRRLAPTKQLCKEKNLIAVNNGIFDYDTKQLLSFSADYVFTTKSRVNYNPLARNITIHNQDDGTDWDVESWMKSLSDDPEIVNVLWEILGAIIRPNVPWGKSAWFYSDTGNNGKGTLCELMRQLCGEGSYASIPLSDMGKDFMLEPLTKATAIIVDENDVGIYIDKAANLKAIITGDTITINRKFKTPLPYQFKGFMVQCLNELPRIKDKSDSFFRRQLFILFTKCFTGVERKYIKNDYLHRQEVLEYVMWRVLNMTYYQLSEPQACKDALADYKEYNDPIRQFASEVMPRLQWDLVPFAFLYDLYVAWYKRNVATTGMEGKTKFLKSFKSIVTEYSEWVYGDVPCRVGQRMSKPEHMIQEYNLTEWMNKRCLGSNDMDKICTPAIIPESCRGIYRI